MAETWKTLPKDCWELIFGQLDDLKPISLVCKEFLLISNSLKNSLRVTHLSVELLPKLLKRFQHLKKIIFDDFYGDPDNAIHEIAYSGLNLYYLDIQYQKVPKHETLRALGASMKNLKTLNCLRVWPLHDIDLFVIADSLPCLEDLDISFPQINCYNRPYYPVSRSSFKKTVTDDGIEVMASKLKRLQKINLSNIYYLSDRSVIALSSNCVLLKEILLNSCNQITQHGIAFLLRNSRNLVTISMYQVEMVISESSPAPSMFTIENSIHYAKALRDLQFFDMHMSDNLLCLIAKLQLPLKELTLSQCRDFSMSGLSLLLRSYKSLTYLDLTGTKLLTDQSIGELSQYLHNLTYIDLSYCSNLTNSTFSILTRNFPALVEIEMVSTRLGKGEDFGTTLDQNHKIQFLNLAKNKYLKDKSLKKFGLICPNLEELFLSDCRFITGTGIGEVLKNCNKIRKLEVSGLSDSKIFGTDSELSQVNLEILGAQLSRIDDEGMAMIGKNCKELQYLHLGSCFKVTDKGVKEVVENCKKLRTISLRKCRNVSADTLDWMESSKPSLHIIPPDTLEEE